MNTFLGVFLLLFHRAVSPTFQVHSEVQRILLGPTGFTLSSGPWDRVVELRSHWNLQQLLEHWRVAQTPFFYLPNLYSYPVKRVFWDPTPKLH